MSLLIKSVITRRFFQSLTLSHIRTFQTLLKPTTFLRYIVIRLFAKVLYIYKMNSLLLKGIARNRSFWTRNKHLMQVNHNSAYKVLGLHSKTTVRLLSSDSVSSKDTKAESASNSMKKFDYDEYDDWEEPKNAREKVNEFFENLICFSLFNWTIFFIAQVAMYSTIMMRLALLGAIATCAFFTAKELFPGRMHANSLFSELFDILRIRDEVNSLLVEYC
jgi:hypothetical protein